MNIYLPDEISNMEQFILLHGVQTVTVGKALYRECLVCRRFDRTEDFAARQAKGETIFGLEHAENCLYAKIKRNCLKGKR